VDDRPGGRENDLLLFVADAESVQSSLATFAFISAKVRLIPRSYRFVWILDFPLLEYDEARALCGGSSPFTAPKDEDIRS